MNESHLTNFRQTEPKCKPKGKRGSPHCVVRHHSVTTPVYSMLIEGKTRYVVSFYRDGRRKRRTFTDLSKAKREAKQIAEKIVRGMQAQNDLNPAEREAFLVAQRILSAVGIKFAHRGPCPLVSQRCGGR